MAEPEERGWLQNEQRSGYRGSERAFFQTGAAKNDPYLETRAKEDAFLERVLDTIREGLRESGGIGVLLGALRGIQPAPPERQPDNAAKRESMETAMSFLDCL